MREFDQAHSKRDSSGIVEGGMALQAEVLTDEELAVQAASGDQQATEALFECYFDRVYDLAYGMVRNRETAADIARSTFLVDFPRETLAQNSFKRKRIWKRT